MNEWNDSGVPGMLCPGVDDAYSPSIENLGVGGRILMRSAYDVSNGPLTTTTS